MSEHWAKKVRDESISLGSYYAVKPCTSFRLYSIKLTYVVVTFHVTSKYHPGFDYCKKIYVYDHAGLTNLEKKLKNVFTMFTINGRQAPLEHW